MALTAHISEVDVANGQIALKVAITTLSTGPYTYQWYKSGTSGFTPGTGNIITGATSPLYVDTSGTGGYYACIVTDSSSATSTASDIESILLQNPQPRNYQQQYLGGGYQSNQQPAFTQQTTH